MDITQLCHPFPHVILGNFYSNEELIHIWKELDFLTYFGKLEEPEKTGSAIGQEGLLLKSNYAIQLDDLYKHRDISNILRLNRKLFSDQLVNLVGSTDFIFEGFSNFNEDRTMVSYYENSHHYAAHQDRCSYTALTWFFKDPKKFSGGDLYFPNYDYIHEIQSNQTLIFPSFVKHQVTEVIMDPQETGILGSMSGLGRYCMTQFCIHNFCRPRHA